MAARLAGAEPGEFSDIAFVDCRRRGRRDHRVAVLAKSAKAAVCMFRDAGSGGATGGVLASGVRGPYRVRVQRERLPMGRTGR